MRKEIIEQWDKNKSKLEEYFEATKQEEYCESYLSILKKVFELVLTDEEWQLDKITVVDDGYYQGTQLFIIPKQTYQPSEDEYLFTAVSYGSCSGCDTLQAISQYGYDLPTKSQVAEYMTLSLHLIQKMKKFEDLAS